MGWGSAFLGPTPDPTFLGRISLGGFPGGGRWHVGPGHWLRTPACQGGGGPALQPSRCLSPCVPRHPGRRSSFS